MSHPAFCCTASFTTVVTAATSGRSPSADACACGFTNQTPAGRAEDEILKGVPPPAAAPPYAALAAAALHHSPSSNDLQFMVGILAGQIFCHRSGLRASYVHAFRPAQAPVFLSAIARWCLSHQSAAGRSNMCDCAANLTASTLAVARASSSSAARLDRSASSAVASSSA